MIERVELASCRAPEPILKLKALPSTDSIEFNETDLFGRLVGSSRAVLSSVWSQAILPSRTPFYKSFYQQESAV